MLDKKKALLKVNRWLESKDSYDPFGINPVLLFAVIILMLIIYGISQTINIE